MVHKERLFRRNAGRWFGFVFGILAVLGLTLVARPASAAFSDCAISWSAFQDNPGFIADYTYLGSPIKDTEKDGSLTDPTNGGTGVQPAYIDLASNASASNGNPGPQTTPYFGYFNGGTVYDSGNVSTMEDDYLFFRMRVQGDPRTSSGFDFNSAHWNILVDVDADGYKEYWVDLEGDYKQNGDPDRLNILYDDFNRQNIPDPDATGVRVEMFTSAAAAVPDASCTTGFCSVTVSQSCTSDANCPSGELCRLSPGLSHNRAFAVGDGSGDWYIDYQIPMTAFNDGRGNQVVFPDKPVRFVFSTSTSNVNPLQKDWMMDLGPGGITLVDPITFGDAVYPNGRPTIEFVSSGLQPVSYYMINGSVYIWVTDRLANTDSAAVETIQVTVADPVTGDDEIITLVETTASSGIFVNTLAGSDPLWVADTNVCSSNFTVSCVDNTPCGGGTCIGSADDDGVLRAVAGNTLYVSYTNANSQTVTDEVPVLGTCNAVVEFTRSNGDPSRNFQLTADQATSDKLYVTVIHIGANTNPATRQDIQVVLSGNDGYTMTLRETGVNTGIFRNYDPSDNKFLTGLPTKIEVVETPIDLPPSTADALWEDNDVGTVTAAYGYSCGGSSLSASNTADLFVTTGGGRVRFTNAAGTQDVELYGNGDPIFIEVDDESVGVSCHPTSGQVTVTVSSSLDSETMTLQETFSNSGVFINAAPAPIVATPGVPPPTPNDGTLEAVDGETLQVSYEDCDDGDGDPNNNTKYDFAQFNAPALVINEVLFFPLPAGSGSCQTEYIEIINPSTTTDVVATGYTVSDGDGFSYQIPQFGSPLADIVLGPGESIVISLYDSASAPASGVYDPTAGVYYLFDATSSTYPSNFLENHDGVPPAVQGSDQLLLKDPLGVAQDYMAWSSTVNTSLDFRSDDQQAVAAGIWQEDAFTNVSTLPAGYALLRSSPGSDTDTPGDWVPAAAASTVCLDIPTRVSLSSFRTYVENGQVVVEWVTDSETDTVGFHVERYDKAKKGYTRLNADILPAMITEPQGGIYSIVDAGAVAGTMATYRLVEREGNGKTNVYGPFTVMVGTESEILRDEVQGVPAPGRSASAMARAQAQKDVKIMRGAGGTVVAGDASAGRRGAGVSRSVDSNGTIVVSGRSGARVTRSSGVPAGGVGYQRAPKPPAEETLLRLDRASKARRDQSVARGLSQNTRRQGGAAVKLMVRETGVYSVDAGTLAGLTGFTDREVQRLIRSSGFTLTNQGEPVAYISDRRGEGLLFYGRSPEGPYAADNVYWLSEGRGIRMPHAGTPGDTGRPSEAVTFVDTVHAEVDQYAAPGIFTDPVADFWLWDFVFAGNATLGQRDFPVVAEGVADLPGDAFVTVRFNGATAAASGKDHHALVEINGNKVGEVSWKGTNAQDLVARFNQVLLHDGENVVTVVGVKDQGVPYSVFYVDSIDLQYGRVFLAVNDELAFTADGEQVVEVHGFTSPEILVFDISNETGPTLVTAGVTRGLNGSYLATIRTFRQGGRYYAVAGAGLKGVASAVVDEPSDLKRYSGADYVVIVGEGLGTAGEKLAEYRKAQGLSTLVVTIEDVFDEFSYGIRTPQAVREFLRYAYASWRIPPRYAVLLGEGSYDYKNVTGSGDSLVPPVMISTSYGLFPSDTVLGDVNADGVPEIAVGRLPVLTEEELTGILDKIVAFETFDPRTALFLSDNADDGGEFPFDSENMVSHIPAAYSSRQISLATLPKAQARLELVQALNEGVRIVNYIGHGSVLQFAGEGLLKSADVVGMTNSVPPLVNAQTCLVGNFGLPGFDSLSETLTVKSGAGSVAVWSPTGLSMNGSAVFLAGTLYQELFSGFSSTLGDAILGAGRRFKNVTGSSDTLGLFGLLGDPATKVQ